MKKNNYELGVLTELVVGALRVYQKRRAASVDPQTALETFFPAKHTFDLNTNRKKRYVAATVDDRRNLRNRYVNYQRSTGKFDAAAIFFDIGKPETWATNSNAPVLIGGESGSGKTLEMICGHSDKSNMVIYMRFADVLMRKLTKYVPLCEAICNNETILRSAARGGVVSPEEEKAARDGRNEAFADLTKLVVKSAIDDSCAELSESLKEHKSGETFTVRLCFDEMGDSPAYVRACCAMDTEALREALGWGSKVEIRVVAAGTGIGSVDNPGGSENNFYQLAMLTQQHGMSFYWTMRLQLWEDRVVHSSRARVSFDELVKNVEMIQNSWHDRPNAVAAIETRNTTLSKLFVTHATHQRGVEVNLPTPSGASYPETVGAKITAEENKRMLKAASDWTSKMLVQEALFSAIETDCACAAALTNPRMAALFVSVVKDVRDRTIEQELSAATSGTNIRRSVLQRVAMRFFFFFFF